MRMMKMWRQIFGCILPCVFHTFYVLRTFKRQTLDMEPIFIMPCNVWRNSAVLYMCWHFRKVFSSSDYFQQCCSICWISVIKHQLPVASSWFLWPHRQQLHHYTDRFKLERCSANVLSLVVNGELMFYCVYVHRQKWKKGLIITTSVWSALYVH